MIWFTADSHLGHAGILVHQPVRGEAFTDTTEMDAELIAGMTRVLRHGDTLWHLGDFCWGASKAGHYRMRIAPAVKFQFHVCRGNHDAASLGKHCSTYQHASFSKFRYKRFHLSHYAHWSWAAQFRGGYHLYGHSHGSVEAALDQYKPGRLSMDVGVDHAFKLLGEWRPFSLDEILSHIHGGDT